MELELWKAATAGYMNFFNKLRTEDLSQVSCEGNSALHIAAKMGHLDLVVFLCRRNTNLLAVANNSGDYPLHCAARAGHFLIVVHINTYEIHMSAVNKLGNTALHEAAQNGHARVVDELLSVDPAMAGITNRAGISPLYLAAERGAVDMVRLLLDTGVASPGGPRGQNALHAAVVRSLEISKLIVLRMPGLITQGDAINNNTPLHYAASHADVEMIKFLLERYRSAAYLRDNGGFSAIHIAASMGHINIIDELLRTCPDCMEMKDVNGRNFLHIAIEKKRVDVVRYVLQSRVLAELANLPDNNGNTALHLAVLSHNSYIIELLSINAEVYTSPMNSSCDTPLDLASSKVGYEVGHRMDGIRRDLIANGSRYRPQRLDLLLESRPRNKVEEINRYRAIVNNLAIVAVLIATVTFAAVFTLPGGYMNDNGTSLRASDPTFKVFLISDTVAMFSSIVATFILINTGSLDHDIRLYSLNAAKKLIWVALTGMTLAFGTNVLVVIKCKWLAVLVCVISCSVPFVAYMATQWPGFDFLKSFNMATRRPGWPVFDFLKTFNTTDRKNTKLFSDMEFTKYLVRLPSFVTPHVSEELFSDMESNSPLIPRESELTRNLEIES